MKSTLSLGRTALVTALAIATSHPLFAQEVERGRQVYKLCEGCHSIKPGEHRFGPSLAGVVGRGAGKLKGYQFSDELAAVKLNWTPANLTQWLSDEPKNMVPGTKMEYPGISNPQDVQALIKYMATLKSK